MWMTDYIRSVKCGLRDQHGLVPNGGTEGDPTFRDVPDGQYPMTIDGKLDHVRITGGQISCCNFTKAEADSREEALRPIAESLGKSRPE